MKKIICVFLIILNYSMLQAAKIHEVAHEGNEAEVKKMVEEDPSLINTQDKWGWTPLMYAASRAQVNVVSLLIDSGAKIDQRDRSGITVLQWVQGSIKNCKNLEERIADLKEQKYKQSNIDGYREVHSPENLKKWEEILALLNEGLEREKCKDLKSPIWAALKEGDVKKVQEILGKNININIQNQDGQTPLVVAVLNGKQEIAALLLEHGSPMEIADKKGNTEFSYAKNMLKILEDAQEKRNIQILIKEIERNPSLINTKDKNGETPLMQAVAIGNIDVIQIFLKSGADPNIRNNKNETLEDVICTRGKYLIQKNKIIDILKNYRSQKHREKQN